MLLRLKKSFQSLFLRRLGRALVVSWGVSLLAFALVRMVPGDPVRVLLGFDASPEREQRMREALHLDGSVVMQYFSYMGSVLKGDLGKSIETTRPVLATLSETLPVTFWLIGLSMLLAIIIAIPLGTYGGFTTSRAYGHSFNLLSSTLISIPVFVSGVLLLLVFAVRLRWVPVAGYTHSFPGNLEYLILPSLVSAIPVGMIFARVLQESIRETNAEEFVETGIVWGIPKRELLWRYLIRPSIAPVIGLMGYIIGALLAAQVIVETVFVLPGVGTFLVRGVLTRDYPVVQGSLLVFGLIVVAIHFLSDAIAASIDPRARTLS